MKKILNLLWFVCDKCGTSYDNHMEEIYDADSEELQWANTPTSNENIWEAITKATIRIQHENKKCESKG